jgi:hypothetical protein
MIPLAFSFTIPDRSVIVHWQNVARNPRLVLFYPNTSINRRGPLARVGGLPTNPLALLDNGDTAVDRKRACLSSCAA